MFGLDDTKYSKSFSPFESLPMLLPNNVVCIGITPDDEFPSFAGAITDDFPQLLW
jgi:hypothetical protein